MKNREYLDLSEGLIILYYSDGTAKVAKMSDRALTIGGFDNTKTGDNTIKISYLNQQTSFEVEIIEADAVSENELTMGTNELDDGEYSYVSSKKKKSLAEIGIYSLVVVSGIILFILIVILLRKRSQKLK